MTLQIGPANDISSLNTFHHKALASITIGMSDDVHAMCVCVNFYAIRVGVIEIRQNAISCNGGLTRAELVCKAVVEEVQLEWGGAFLNSCYQNTACKVSLEYTCCTITHLGCFIEFMRLSPNQDR